MLRNRLDGPEALVGNARMIHAVQGHSVGCERLQQQPTYALDLYRNTGKEAFQRSDDLRYEKGETDPEAAVSVDGLCRIFPSSILGIRDGVTHYSILLWII